VCQQGVESHPYQRAGRHGRLRGKVVGKSRRWRSFPAGSPPHGQGSSTCMQGSDLGPVTPSEGRPGCLPVHVSRAAFAWRHVTRTLSGRRTCELKYTFSTRSAGQMVRRWRPSSARTGSSLRSTLGRGMASSSSTYVARRRRGSGLSASVSFCQLPSASVSFHQLPGRLCSAMGCSKAAADCWAGFRAVDSPGLAGGGSMP
jgi:hypothetical protein